MYFVQTLALGRRSTENLVKESSASDATRQHLAARLQKSDVVSNFENFYLDVFVSIFGLCGDDSRLEVDQVTGIVFDDDEDLAIALALNEVVQAVLDLLRRWAGENASTHRS